MQVRDRFGSRNGYWSWSGRQLCPGSGVDDGQPWVVGFHFRATSGWAGATRKKTRGALRDK